MNRESFRMQGGVSTVGKVAGVLVPTVLAIFFIAFTVCYLGIFYNNPVTPAGYAGYVTRGAIAGKSEFVKVQYGPTSSGAGWLLSATNVPLTPRTYEEDFSGAEGIVAGDNTSISFAVNVTMRIRHNVAGGNQDWVRMYVEKYTTLHAGDTPEKILSNTYLNNLKQPIRGYVRLAAESHKGLDIQDNMPKIADEVFAKVQTLTANTPFEVTKITIGRIHYPETVTNQVANNLIATQRILQQNIQTDLTTRDARMMVIDNEGLAAAADIINKSITPQWLQYQALLAQQDNIKSQSTTNLMIEVGPMGVPTVGGVTPPTK
jgi:hypothetical protein